MALIVDDTAGVTSNPYFIGNVTSSRNCRPQSALRHSRTVVSSRSVPHGAAAASRGLLPHTSQRAARSSPSTKRRSGGRLTTMPRIVNRAGTTTSLRNQACLGRMAAAPRSTARRLIKPAELTLNLRRTPYIDAERLYRPSSCSRGGGDTGTAHCPSRCYSYLFSASSNSNTLVLPSNPRRRSTDQ